MRRATGRYRSVFSAQALKLCRLGAGEAELADFFGVSLAMLMQWREAHADFDQALRQGSALADAEVAESLFRRATGYSYEAVKVAVDAKTGAQSVVPYREHCPPDVSAALFWLKSRRPDWWRDRVPPLEPLPLGEVRVVLVRPEGGVDVLRDDAG